MKHIRILSEHFQFLVVKFSIHLNRRVFVMGAIFPFRVDPFLSRGLVCGKANRKSEKMFPLVEMLENLQTS